MLLLAALPALAAAQDAVKTDPAHYKVILDNASLRVLRISVATGAKTPMHSHPDGMLVSLGDGTTTFTFPDVQTLQFQFWRVVTCPA